MVVCNQMAGKLFCQPALTELGSANSKQGWREPFSATNQRMTNTGHCRTFPTWKKGREGEGAVENCLESKFLWQLTLSPLTRIPCFSLASISAEVWDPHRNSGNNDKTSRTKFRLRFVVKSGPSVAIKSPACRPGADCVRRILLLDQDCHAAPDIVYLVLRQKWWFFLPSWTGLKL